MYITHIACFLSSSPMRVYSLIFVGVWAYVIDGTLDNKGIFSDVDDTKYMTRNMNLNWKNFSSVSFHVEILRSEKSRNFDWKVRLNLRSYRKMNGCSDDLMIPKAMPIVAGFTLQRGCLPVKGVRFHLPFKSCDLAQV